MGEHVCRYCGVWEGTEDAGCVHIEGYGFVHKNSCGPAVIATLTRERDEAVALLEEGCAIIGMVTKARRKTGTWGMAVATLRARIRGEG